MKSEAFVIIIAAAAAIAAAGCSDAISASLPEPGNELPEGEIEVGLNLNVNKATSVGSPFVSDISRADGDESGDGEDAEGGGASSKEESVHDIWVLQFGEDGQALVAPRYYSVTSDVVERLNIRLAEAENCHLYVLANTGDESWAAGKDFSTLEKFRRYELPFTQADIIRDTDNEYIPMIGDIAGLTFRKQSDLKPVDIYLTRMLSKISFSYVTEAQASGLICNRIIISNMPTGIRMEHDDEAEVYPSGSFETQSYTFDRDLKSGAVYTFYMPENRQGISGNTDPGTKNNGAPDRALYVQLFISSKSNGSSFLYTVYPGEDAVNDFNVRRNHNYNIRLTLKTENRDDRVLAAPANCFVLGYNEEIMFDPYARTETAGGYRYSDYVNKEDPKKRIESVRILWQQQNVIGDNTYGNKVYLDEFNRVKVHSASTAGNALIAGYNADNEIVWSWHIWVNPDKPANLDEAVPYNTFAWDASGIKASQGRTVKGRALMKCNLGARRATGVGLQTYGALYQWGRKDPLPAGWNKQACDPHYPYTAANVGVITDNSNSPIPMTGDGVVGHQKTGELFWTVKTSASVGTVAYTIKHPTHFLATADPNPATGANLYGPIAGTTVNNGDWLWGGDDCLWGGTPFSSATMTYLAVAGSSTAPDGILSNNGAKEKSIFDPCPAGWMVPPGDMWLGFTKDGLNSGWGNEGVVNATNMVASNYGLIMYVQGWRTGPTVYFPSQGFRYTTGSPWRNGSCGNYHTSTAGKNGTVNCFHMHNAQACFPFEPGYDSTRRSFAGAVRCVRDQD